LRCAGFLGLALAPREAAADVFELSLGVVAQGGIEGQPEPSPNRYTLLRSGAEVEEPAYTSFGYGAGIAIEARVLEVVALGAEALYMSDGLTGTVIHDGQEVTLSLRQPALHVPLYAKGIWPLPVIAPFALVGVELVLPGLSTVEVEPAGAHAAVASAESHTLLLLGAGVETEWNSLRLQAGLRFALQLGASSALDDRVTVLPSDAVVRDASPSYQAMLALGASYVF